MTFHHCCGHLIIDCGQLQISVCPAHSVLWFPLTESHRVQITGLKTDICILFLFWQWLIANWCYTGSLVSIGVFLFLLFQSVQGDCILNIWIHIQNGWNWSRVSVKLSLPVGNSSCRVNFRRSPMGSFQIGFKMWDLWRPLFQINNLKSIKKTIL